MSRKTEYLNANIDYLPLPIEGPYHIIFYLLSFDLIDFIYCWLRKIGKYQQMFEKNEQRETQRYREGEGKRKEEIETDGLKFNPRIPE